MVFLYRIFANLTSVEILMYVIWFLPLSASLRCFFPQNTFPNNGMVKLPWASLIWDLHDKERIIRMSIPGLSTGSPWGVCGLGWSTCLLHGDPLLGLLFINASWCVSLVWWRGIFLLISCLRSYFYTLLKFAFYFSLSNDFTRINVFDYKYSVLSSSLDLVTTLCN